EADRRVVQKLGGRRSLAPVACTHLVEQPGGCVDADVGRQKARLELLHRVFVERPLREPEQVARGPRGAAIDPRLELGKEAGARRGLRVGFFRIDGHGESVAEGSAGKFVSVAHMAKRSNARRELPGSVRIIAGEWRGRRVPIAPGTEVRPTPDRVRETLFNWLMHTIAGAKCLDLYAGTGALGFEALSRGA